MTILLKPLTLIAIASALTTIATCPAAAVSLDASAADALSAQFVANAFLTTLSAVAPVEGSVPPSYDKQNSLPTYYTILHIADTKANDTAFYVQLNGVVDRAKGSGIGVDSYGSEGDSKIATAALSLNLYPPPPAEVVPLVPLQISASAVQGSASYSVVVPRPPHVSGTASFSNLIITGSLVGGQTLTYSGTPPANTVLFRNAEVTITLNEQLTAATATCIVSQGCTVTPAGIYVNAVHVSLRRASVFGRIVSGDFFLGHAQAGS